MPAKFWPDTTVYYGCSWNRLCHRDQKMTLIELFSDKTPSVCHLRPFRSLVYMGIPKHIEGINYHLKQKSAISKVIP